MNIKTREEKMKELLNAIDGANLLAQGKSLIKFAPYKSPDQEKPKTEADRQLERAMFQLHKIKMRMYAEGNIY
jgi:hypothetical protein